MSKKNTFLLVSTILLLFISCNNNYNSAEKLYLSEQFELAKNELAKIENIDSEKAENLLRKIDSSIYQKSLREYRNDNLEKSSGLLESIDSLSPLFTNKTELLKQISIKEDSLKYSLAVDYYSSLDLIKADELIEYILPSSPYYEKKIELYKQILKKTDSINYQKAQEYYYNNYLDSSKARLDEIHTNSPYYSNKEKLLKKISSKRKTISKKEILIAKAVISSVFGPSPSIMKAKVIDPGVYQVSYFNRDAGKSYGYKVKFEGNKAYWGANDGRWRYDDIYYTETTDSYYITETYSDGSTRKDKFYKRNLK